MWSAVLLSLGLHVGASTEAPKPMPATLIALETRDHAQTRALTQRIEAAGGWWLELRDQLFVAAPEAELQSLAQSYALGPRLPALTPQALALQARGCGIDNAAKLPAIAEAGRFALVWAPRRFVSYVPPDSTEWRSIQPNTVLSRDTTVRGEPSLGKGGGDPAIQARVDAVDPQRWFDALSTLSSFDRSSYGLGIDQARDWLAGQFGELGLTVELQNFTFTASGVPASLENVVARRTGTDLPDEWIVVGGHYDSRNTSITSTSNTPGAEDNASGCAGVLEMARVFSVHRPRRTMIFVCFGGEEQGLFGGNAFATKLSNDGDLGKVKLAVIMDMIGYSGDTDLDVLLETSTALSSVFTTYQNAAPIYAPELRVVTSVSPCCSDHMPFINRSVPSLLTIEDDWSQYTHYHRTTDIPANITRALQMGGGILKLNAAVLAQAAGIPQALFADGFE